MLLVAESVYEGTWSSGEVPAELMEFELMLGMSWSWTDFQATPLYVRRYCWDLLQARRQAEQDANERANCEAQGGSPHA